MEVVRVSLLVLFLALCCTRVIAQVCESRTASCGDCIQTPGCVWCADITFEGPRCQDGSITTCTSVQRPPAFSQETTNSEADNPVSIRNINLFNLLVGVPTTFTVSVTALRNLPLDLYILMDLSFSMSDELDTVKSVADQIANRIGDITDNVRLGFGSFNDNVTRPFTHNISDSPDCCADRTRMNCDPYAFRHQIDLTSNTTKFKDAIQAVTNTENVDNPENGLEALAQVVSCESVIGWRSRTADGMERGLTRVVLFLTDDQFHYSGEGRDYPSVGQVVALLTQFEVVTIFAVSESALPTYQNLTDLINLQYRASTAALTSNSTQLLDLIRTEYRAILQDVRLNVPRVNDLNIAVQTTCPNDTQPIITGNGFACSNVLLDTTATYKITVTLNSCEFLRSSANMTRTARFNIPTFGEFNITYSGACNCDCEQDTEFNSQRCSGNGNYECGVCRCNLGFCGADCSIVLADQNVVQDCPDNCSNRGVCDCTCMCAVPTRGDDLILDNILNTNPSYVGSVFSGAARSCECDNFRCGLGSNGQSCSGNGVCCNRRCECSVYQGSVPNPLNATYHQRGAPGQPGNCECPPESVVCCRESSTRVCNGSGECRCEICECSTGYTGQCCTIPAMCDMSEDVNCALCGVGGDCSICDQTRRRVVVIPMNVLTDDRQNIMDYVIRSIGDRTTYNIQSGDNACDAVNETGCTYNYYVLSNGTNVVVGVVDFPACPIMATAAPLAIPIWAIPLIILAGLVIIGF